MWYHQEEALSAVQLLANTGGRHSKYHVLQITVLHRLSF